MIDSLVNMGREWLANSPPAKISEAGLTGWSGPVGFVCSSCASRIMGRGCNFKALADCPVWENPQTPCSLCDKV
jgi:hypothetical protein